ncbi:MAG: ABC transporter permease [Methanotrichaceae archaeon]
MESDEAIKKFKILLLKSSGLVAFVLLWEAAPHLGLIDPIFIPPPSIIILKIYELMLSGELLINASASLERVLTGFILALIVALPLGFMMGGWFKTFETAVNPLLQVLGQANPFTLFPVFMALLGIGELSKIGIIYWVCQWPILFNTVSGINSVDPVYIKVGRSMGMNRFKLFSKVLLPAAMPAIFTGIRMSAVFSFFMLIGAEMIGAHSGLGFLIIQSEAVFNMPKMYAAIVSVALLGILINIVMLNIERRLLSWKENIAV